jgi:hypothetical protein
MELKGIFLLAIFLISTSVLTYLHIKHKIDWKLVFILPIVVIVFSFFIINQDKFNTIAKLKFSEVEVEMAKKEIDESLNKP